MYREALLGKGELSKIAYTSSIIDDSEIFRETILALITHVNELERQGILRRDEAKAIRDGLRGIFKDGYRPIQGYEDVHEYVEAELIRRIGPIGGWVGLGRSRNDHVAAAIRLRLRRMIIELMAEANRLRSTALGKALETLDKPIIGSTHRQPAQAATLAMYMLYIDELTRDFLGSIKEALNVVNRSPLGTGPLAGVLTRLDRVREAGELGFSGIVENPIYATGSRFFALLASSITVSYLVELGRFINTLEMWLMPQLNYINADPSHLATSSIMPHKRNPATLEVFRARIGEAMGHLVALMSIERPVESGYQLDLQEATRHVWAIFKIAKDGLAILADFIKGIDVNVDRVLEDSSKYPITASEYVEERSISEHRPFREVYREAALMIKNGSFKGPSIEEVLKSKDIISNARSIAESRLREVDEDSKYLDKLWRLINEAEEKLLTEEG